METKKQRSNRLAAERGMTMRGLTWKGAHEVATKSFGYTGLSACIFADAATGMVAWKRPIR